MNNTFNIQRFGLLLKRQWLEFGKIYLITLAVAMGVIVTFYSFALTSIITEENPFSSRVLQFREPLFMVFGFLFITVIASSYFAHLGQKPKAIIDLMIPASTFEKFLTGVMFTAIMSTLSFFLIFYLTDLAFIAQVKDISLKYGEPATYFFAKNKPKEFESIFMIIPIFITSIFLAGSIYFNKFHYIKTAISVMIFSGLWAFIIFKTGEALFKGRVHVEQVEMNNAPKGWIELGVFAVFLLLTAIFWTITYVRLKEKQV